MFLWRFRGYLYSFTSWCWLLHISYYRSAINFPRKSEVGQFQRGFTTLYLLANNQVPPTNPDNYFTKIRLDVAKNILEAARVKSAQLLAGMVILLWGKNEWTLFRVYQDVCCTTSSYSWRHQSQGNFTSQFSASPVAIRMPFCAYIQGGREMQS